MILLQATGSDFSINQVQKSIFFSQNSEEASVRCPLLNNGKNKCHLRIYSSRGTIPDNI
jgi:hypothetical protein